MSYPYPVNNDVHKVFQKPSLVAVNKDQFLLRRLKLNLDSVIAISFFIAGMVPYISYIGRGSVVSFALFFAWTLSIIFNKGEIYKILHGLLIRKLELWSLFIFLLIALYYYLFVTPTAKALQFTLMPLIYFFVIVMDVYYYGRDPRYKFSIFFVVLIILGIQAAISIPYVMRSEDLVSRMYTSGELEGTQLVDALTHGVGSANLYSFLCGVFFLGIGSLNKFSKNIRFIMILCLILILLSILASSYSVAFWMLSIGAIIFLLRSDWKRIKFKYIVLAAGLCTVFIVLYNSFLANSTVIGPIERKIELIKTGNLEQDGRMDLAANSMNTFLNNPFFGVGVPEWGDEKTIGSHLPWIDLPAQYGFLGFLPFLLFLFILFKRNYRLYFRSPKKNTYATTCLIGTSIYILTNFIDPVIFETSAIIMLLFFYCSMFNWGNHPLANSNLK